MTKLGMKEKYHAMTNVGPERFFYGGAILGF